MRIVFCGNPEFALPTLDALLASSHDVVAVVTSPDQPQGRGRKLTPMPVKSWADAKGLHVLSPPKLKNSEFLDQLKSLAPDVLVVVAFRILPHEMFSFPRWGALNVHPSLLPKGRGPAPIQWTLLRGETETGVTIIRLTEEIDGGGMLAQKPTPVRPDETFGDLHDRMSVLGARMLVEVLDQLSRGESITPIQQDESQVTTARKLGPDDYILDFAESSEQVLRRIRAFSPVPGAVAQADEFRMKVLQAGAATESPYLPPGQVKVFQDSVLIGTADQPISLKQVIPSGKKAMAIEDYLRGRPILPARFEKPKTE